MNGFNPMLDYQRNQLIAQQAMIQNQLNQLNHMNQSTQPQFNPYPQQNNQPQFFVRQVGDIEEAKGFPVDPAIMYFFLDTGTGKIYMKRLNTDNGKSEFYTYCLQENIDEKKNDPIEQINLRLTNIENIIGGLKNESVSSNENNAKSNAKYPTANDDEISTAKSSEISTGSTDDKRKK